MSYKIVILIALLAFALALINNCAHTPRHVATLPERADDVIVVCGERIHTGTRVVPWNEPAGYNGYLEHRFLNPNQVRPSSPADGCDTPRRYSVRAALLDDEGEVLPLSPGEARSRIRQNVDQIVLHYDAAGTSRRCFEVLHDERGLSAHFLIDLDGVIYQTLDVRERARHAAHANDRSVGIEIANVGAYASEDALETARSMMDLTYGVRGTGALSFLGVTGPVVGQVQGRRLHQYRYTDAQYDALIRLIGGLRRALPRVRSSCPAASGGEVLDRVLSPNQWERFAGILGHHHISSAKVDPGPAFDWSRLMSGVNRLPANP